MQTASATTIRSCPHCGGSLRAGANFCGSCGGSVGAMAPVPAKAPAAPLPPQPTLTTPPPVPADPGPARSPVSRLLQGFTMIINPGAVLKTSMERFPWPLALTVSGLAFLLFFLQTGLDLGRAGHADNHRIAVLAFTGLLYGTLGIALVGSAAWLLTRPFHQPPRAVGWVVRAFCLGYSAALVYGVLGLGANLLLGWNTAIAFGVTGVLWALGPMTGTIKELIADKPWVAVAVATLCGGVVLFGWAWLGGIAA